MGTIYTEDGKILIEKKQQVTEGSTQNLVEIAEHVRENNKAPKEKKDVLDRPPMRVCATGITAGGIGIGTAVAVSGVDLSVSTIIGIVSFYLTMIAKGSRHSSYCIALAVANILFSTVTLVIKLKQLGWFDWLQYMG